MLQSALSNCTLCPRLRAHCSEIARTKRKSYVDQKYWGKPVPGFGDPKAKLLVVGLAPGAHGANRTGRIFTGDRSGEWLYRALYRAGFSNQAESISLEDGLKLTGAAVTCVVKCAPPDNKPTPAEIHRCVNHYLTNEIQSYTETRVIIALGKIAWDAVRRIVVLNIEAPGSLTFAHGREIKIDGKTPPRYLLGSYHPSQQNTFTGRLTESMFDQIFARAVQLIKTSQ